MKQSGILLLLLSLVFCGYVTSNADGFGSGLLSVVDNYGLSEQIKDAKRRHPNSKIPSYIEHVLTGLSMARDPVVTMEAVYPGALAANAIGPLIEMHGEDIARMTYRDRKVFIGDE